MVAVTYYSLFSSGVTVFTGYVTNSGSQCSSGASIPALCELSTVNSLCASSPRISSTTPTTNFMRFAVGGFTAPTIVSAASFQIWIRKASTKTFWLEGFNSAGAKVSGSTVPVSVTGSSTMANVVFPYSVTVPAGGALVLRSGFTGASSQRLYFGTNPKGNGLPSAVLTTTQLPAVTGPVATVSGSLGVIGGSSTGLIQAPVVRYYTSTIFNSDGTPAQNGVQCYLLELTGEKSLNHLAGTSTINHPAGHPSLAGQPGWVAFTNTDALPNQVDRIILVLDQVGTTGVESGVSVAGVAQLTNDGNG